MPSGPDNSTVAAVLERAGYCCEPCGKPLGEVRGVDYSIHHRKPRGMGGTRFGANLPSNLMAVCGSGTTGCHGWIESNRFASLASGWLVSRYKDPAEVPAQIGSWFALLTNQATYQEVA